MIDATYHCLGECDGFCDHDQPALWKLSSCFAASPRRWCLPPLRAITWSITIWPRCSPLGQFRLCGAEHPAGAADGRLVGAVSVSLLSDRGHRPAGTSGLPTTLLEITAVLEKKTAMLVCHANHCDRLRAYHGTDEYLDMMRRHAAARGKLLGVPAAEGFVQHRGHPYPQDDLLRTPFSICAGGGSMQRAP